MAKLKADVENRSSSPVTITDGTDEIILNPRKRVRVPQAYIDFQKPPRCVKIHAQNIGATSATKHGAVRAGEDLRQAKSRKASAELRRAQAAEAAEAETEDTTTATTETEATTTSETTTEGTTEDSSRVEPPKIGGSDEDEDTETEA